MEGLALTRRRPILQPYSDPEWCLLLLRDLGKLNFTVRSHLGMVGVFPIFII